MAGGNPAQDEDESCLETGPYQSQSMAGSFNDRSVTEIETSFSEHFIPAIEDEDDMTPVNSEEIEDLSSAEFNVSLNKEDALHQKPMQVYLDPNLKGKNKLVNI